MEKSQEPRISIALPEDVRQGLIRYSKQVRGRPVGKTASELLEKMIDKLEAEGKIPPPNSVFINEDDWEQVIGFIKLLAGQEDRDNISFSVLGEILSIESELLNKIYNTVREHQVKMVYE